MSGSSVLLWAVSGVTFVVALFAVVDQASLHQEMASQVFRIDETDQTAYLAPGIQRVVIGSELPPGGIELIPSGSVYISAAMRFSSGHVMERDETGNLVLYAEATPGFRTRLATFTPEGAVGLGEVPPETNVDGGVFVTGRAASSARDGWMMHSEANVTDTQGRVYATMGTVQNLEDPSETGVQFRTGDGTLTFSDGKVYIGYVSNTFKTRQGASSKVMVGGDVLVQSELQTLQLPIVSIERPACSTGNYLMPRVFTYTGTESSQSLTPLQGNETDWTVTYFENGKNYASDTIYQYFGISVNGSRTVSCTSENEITITPSNPSFPISTPKYETGHYYTCFCPRNQFEVNAYKAPVATSN
jgi:hypothetical protein